MNDKTTAHTALQQARARHDALFSQPPRMAPLDVAEIGEEEVLTFANRLRRAALGEAVKPLTLEEVPEIVPTLFRHPALWERFSAVSIELLARGELSPRDRELVVLRVGWLLQAPFEFGEHVKQAKLAGVTDEEVERAIAGSEAPGWSDYDRALMRATEELKADAMISDATWATLAERLNDKQLFELTVLVGQFTAVAYFQNALRLRLPNGNRGLEAR